MRNKLEPLKLIALIIAILAVSSFVVNAQCPPPPPQDPCCPQKVKVVKCKPPKPEKEHIKGVVIGRKGDVATVRIWDELTGNDIRDVVLDGDTKIETTTAFWAKKRNATLVYPGMRVEVWGTKNDQSQLIARKITFDRHDMRMLEASNGAIAPLEAETALLRDQQAQLASRTTSLEGQQQKLAGQQDELQTGQQQLKGQVSQLQGEQDQLKGEFQRTKEEVALFGKRISELDEYETRDTAKVNFASGKSTLSPEAKATLDEIAAKALSTSGYLVEVVGFTDSAGEVGANYALSRRRADAVIEYLESVKGVPIRRVLTPAGFGEQQPVADNTTAIGRAENRRAEIKVLVNRAMVKN